jgi:N-acetyl-gamma-glutamyl-phosphate reductase
MSQAKRIGVVGARGHTGRELLTLLHRHPDVVVELACSGSAAGRPVRDVVPEWETDLTFTAPSPEVAVGLDAVFLALPNDASGDYVAAIEQKSPACVVIDLSADHRFDDAWAYGLPERNRDVLRGATRIANPGCYATAIQLGLGPVKDVLDGVPVAFGVSGYSGAGTTPSRKNDPEVLRDNLLPYALTDHVHEREVSRHLFREVAFHPHVASFFRGISVTLSLPLAPRTGVDHLLARLHEAYGDEPLVEVLDDIPEVRDVAGQPGARIGGVTAHGARGVIISTLDNLLKGAATQAVQNLNLALGLEELAGIRAA